MCVSKMESGKQHFWLHGLWLIEARARGVKRYWEGEDWIGVSLVKMWPFSCSQRSSHLFVSFFHWLNDADPMWQLVKSGWWGCMERMFWGTCCAILRLPVLDALSSLKPEQSSSVLKAVVRIQQVCCPDALSGTWEVGEECSAALSYWPLITSLIFCNKL